jgi:hypothetical protein
MNYEEWDKHTTELQNRYGYTGNPKPDGALAKTSVYEFVNDWLPQQLAWLIFSYAAEPHVPKQVIANHYNGIGQRFYVPGGREPGRWKLRWEGAGGRLLKTSEQCLRMSAKFNRNLIVDFLTSVRKREPMRYGTDFTNGRGIPYGQDLSVRCFKQSLNVNKVKGRTKLIKAYTKRFKLDPDDEFALYNQFVAEAGYTLSFTQHIAVKKSLHDNESADAAVAMCQAIQAI